MSKEMIARIDTALSNEHVVDRVASLLPAGASDKRQVRRFLNRALLYFATSQNDSLRSCTPESFIECVVKAAELGFALDGRMCYAVPYKGVASFQPSYLGLVSLARRSGAILSIDTYNVHEGDVFHRRRIGGHWELEFEPRLALRDRGAWVGACCEITSRSGELYCDFMDNSEINAIRARSRSFQAGKGPWISDEGEMRRKTVARRALKWFADDPFSPLADALSADDADYVMDVEATPVPAGRIESLPAQQSPPAQPATSPRKRAPTARPKGGAAVSPEMLAAPPVDAEAAEQGNIAPEREPGDEQAEPMHGSVDGQRWTRRTISEQFAVADREGPAALRDLYDQLCGPDTPIQDPDLIHFASQMYESLRVAARPTSTKA